MDEQEIKINVHIAGRSYPLKVKEQDEEVIKKITEEVNEKITYFQRTYAQRDKQDCVSMALLTYAVDLFRLKENASQEKLSHKVKELDKLLEDLIQ